MSKVYDEITTERARQDEQWGGPEHDDRHSPDDWFRFINEQSFRFWQYQRQGAPPSVEARARLVNIAALVVAGIESIDRKAATNE